MKREVSSEDFYKVIGPLDVVLKLVEPYPYRTLFKMRHSERLVGYEDRNGTYYLIEEEEQK